MGNKTFSLLSEWLLIYSSYRSLRTEVMLTLKDPSARLTQWASRLSEFDYQVLLKPGKKHANADALSWYINMIAIPFISKQDVAWEQQRDPFRLNLKRNLSDKYQLDN